MFKKNKDLVLIGLIGLGLFAQSSEINLANNTTILLVIFFLLHQDERINELSEIEKLEHCRFPSPCSNQPRGFCDGFFR